MWQMVRVWSGRTGKETIVGGQGPDDGGSDKPCDSGVGEKRMSWKHILEGLDMNGEEKGKFKTDSQIGPEHLLRLSRARNSGCWPKLLNGSFIWHKLNFSGLEMWSRLLPPLSNIYVTLHYKKMFQWKIADDFSSETEKGCHKRKISQPFYHLQDTC